jgi:CRISPR/Cas system-associated protein endoribonuclease Cas2
VDTPSQENWKVSNFKGILIKDGYFIKKFDFFYDFLYSSTSIGLGHWLLDRS